MDQQVVNKKDNGHAHKGNGDNSGINLGCVGIITGPEFVARVDELQTEHREQASIG